jgi:hypothetical protein
VTVRAHEAETLVVLTDDEKASYEQLAVFMGQVALKPEAFPVTGRLAASIKTRARQLKGDAQPQSRKNKRKERQERRMRTSKARRRTRREDAEAYNVARTKMEAEIAEMQAIQDERQAQIEAEPKFTVVDIMGNVLIDNVPSSMIVSVDGGSMQSAVVEYYLDQKQALGAGDASGPDIATQSFNAEEYDRKYTYP